MKKHSLLFLTLLILICSCSQEFPTKNPFKKIDYLTLPTYTEKGINVVVEIPAGTNHKIEINKTTGVFENDSIDGEIRIVDFLPYPGNYGFIPSTHMDKERGGDGDALDVLVISESVPTGTVLDIHPLGVIMLEDKGEIDSKIIAVPIDSSLNVLEVYDFQSFMIEEQAAKRLIEDWFLNYKGIGVMELKGWRDEEYALKEIDKWTIGN